MTTQEPNILIPSGAPEESIAFHGGTLISRRRAWDEALALASEFPEKAPVLNLCTDRYLFLITLLAAFARRLPCLLPPSAQDGVLREILSNYPDSFIACDQDVANQDFPLLRIRRPGFASPKDIPDLDPEQSSIICFTSGTTGTPRACLHPLWTFTRSAEMALDSLQRTGQALLVVSTTPPQHMYGLETSIFWPLCSKLSLHSGRPFFPEDVRREIARAPMPALLVSTPTHLRAIAAAGGPWSNLAGIVSSTAPLSDTLAQTLEREMSVSVTEIYGSTETLSFASRNPARNDWWTPYQGASVRNGQHGGALLDSNHLTSVIALGDELELSDKPGFRVLGRSSDMLKIAGKRASLSELNRRLKDIEGVEDGEILTVDDGRGESRTVAIVVSRLDRQAIRSALGRYLDDVFLPRRICYVDTIARNAVGKLSKEEADRLLDRVGD